MQSVSCPIETIAVGSTASMGTVLLAAGTPGRRYALPNATIHLHQPLGGARGQAVDLQIQAEEILRLRRRLNEILVKHTKQPLERIEHDTDRDFLHGCGAGPGLWLGGRSDPASPAQVGGAEMSGAGSGSRCSFCGRSEQMVKRLISGPDSVYICDACVTLCKQILDAGSHRRRRNRRG